MMLDAHPKATVADFAAMQVDDVDLTAQALLPHLLSIEPRLDGWNGRADRDAAQPLIFNAWMIAFNRLLLASLGVTDNAAAAPWPDLVSAALSPSSTLCSDGCVAMLRDSHDRAMASLSQRFGADPAAWRWGNAHEAVFATLALRAIPVLGKLAEARIAQSGSDSTVGRGGVQQSSLESVHGAAYRGVYDLADLERSRFIVAPGQSGHPISTFARNFVGKWRDGDTLTISAQPASVSANIRLTP
jgi:penicillin amidase